jgi:hypothetical protein
MLILLPPSEGKLAPRRGRPLDLASLSFPALVRDREQLLESLVGLCTSGPPAVAAEVLGLGSTRTGEVTRNARLREAPTARSDVVYNGVLYEALDVTSLAGPARRRAASWLAVTSGLFGLLRATDRIPAYRLSGDAVLPGLGGVAGHWRGALSGVDEIVGAGLVVDLRSGMYAAFWRPPAALAPHVATVRVLHDVCGKRQVVSHFNKATKGRIVRSLLESGAIQRTPTRLAEALRDLGWGVELGAPTSRGTPVDVIVDQL